jgi:hypothetical protein
VLFRSGILFKSDRLEQGGSFLSNVWGETDGVTDPAKRSSINTFAVNATEGGFDAESHHFVSAEHYYYWKRAGLLDREYQQKIFIDTPTPSSNTYALYGGIKFYKIWKSSESADRLSKLDAANKYKSSQDDFKQHAKQIMVDAIRYKFSDQNPSLVKALVSTGDKVLGKMHDAKTVVWDVMGTKNGYNWLGEILMNRRKELIISDEQQVMIASEMDVDVKQSGCRKKRTGSYIDWNDLEDDT